MQMVNLHWDTDDEPSLADVERKFRLDPLRVDESFGIIEIDPDEHLFTIRLEASEVEKLRKAGAEIEGPFADEIISAFGPPKSGRE